MVHWILMRCQTLYKLEELQTGQWLSKRFSKKCAKLSGKISEKEFICTYLYLQNLNQLLPIMFQKMLLYQSRLKFAFSGYFNTEKKILPLITTSF